jgi:hypothetical protein
MNDANTNTRPEPETTLTQDVRALLKHWLRGWRGLTVLGVAGVAAGLWLGWSSLVAAGLAPLLLGVLPCIAMCALGLCMRHGGKSSCDSHDNKSPTNSGISTAKNAKDSKDDV